MTNILPRFGMESCRPVSTTIDTKTSLGKASDSDTVFEQNLYQRMIGSLMYLVTWTRPDLAICLSYCYRFSSHALERNHTAVKRVCRYLPATRSMSLLYKRSATSVPLSIVAFSDSDYASCRDTRRSVSAYAFMWNGCTISWHSKKQQSVASSTTEAEYKALATTSRQAGWYLNAFTQLGYTIPITIMADNTSSINVAENPINNPRTKHIDVVTAKVRDLPRIGIPLPNSDYKTYTYNEIWSISRLCVLLQWDWLWNVCDLRIYLMHVYE